MEPEDGEVLSKDEVKERLKIAAMSESIMVKWILSTHSISVFETLALMGDVAVNVQELRDREQSYKERMVAAGRPIVEGQHEDVHQGLDSAYHKVDAAFDALLDASADLYHLFYYCDCKHCTLRRTRERADLQ